MAHFQPQALVRVQLRHIHHPFTDLGLDAKLFVQLTRQRLLGRLARLALAARELPQASHVAGAVAAVEQDAATRVGDDGGHDVDGAQRRGHGIEHAENPAANAISGAGDGKPSPHLWRPTVGRAAARLA